MLFLTDPDTGESALHVAVSLNCEDTTKQLLELGASTRVQDNDGCTAVMKACMYGHLQVLEILATRGLTFDGRHDFSITLFFLFTLCLCLFLFFFMCMYM